MALSSKAKYIHTLNLASYILERNSCIYIPRIMHKNIYDSNAYNSKKLKSAQCSLMGELIRKYYIAMTYEWTIATGRSIEESHGYNAEQKSKS